MPVPTPTERVGNILAQRYHLERLLARGGMGVLYLGRHTLTGRRVAVKVMRSTDEPGTSLADRFLREARLAAGIEHPNVVQIFDMGVDQECLFLVMELLDGEPLANYIEREQVLSAQLALQWALPIMGALATAHDMRVIHRDVKPDNIFLARRGQSIVPTLLDFGIAKQAGGGTLTQSGIAIGTPAYMSPEQARGEIHVGPQTDVWAMGVVLYRCLSGQLPFTAPSPTGVLVKIVSERAPGLAERAPTLNPLLARCIDRALHRDASMRYPDMREFASALAQVATAQGIPLPPNPDPIGLPAWHSWVSNQGPAQVTTAASGRVVAPSEAGEVHGASEAAQSGQRSSTPSPAPRAKHAWRYAALVVALIGVAGALWWQGTGSGMEAGSGPDTPPVVLPVSPSEPVLEPAEPRTNVSPEERARLDGEHARPPTAGADAATIPVRAAEPEPPRRRPRPPKHSKAASGRREARAQPNAAAGPSQQSAPEPAPAATPSAPAATPEDPFQIRRVYRATQAPGSSD